MAASAAAAVGPANGLVAIRYADTVAVHATQARLTNTTGTATTVVAAIQACTIRLTSTLPVFAVVAGRAFATTPAAAVAAALCLLAVRGAVAGAIDQALVAHGTVSAVTAAAVGPALPILAARDAWVLHTEPVFAVVSRSAGPAITAAAVVSTVLVNTLGLAPAKAGRQADIPIRTVPAALAAAIVPALLVLTVFRALTDAVRAEVALMAGPTVSVAAIVAAFLSLAVGLAGLLHADTSGTEVPHRTDTATAAAAVNAAGLAHAISNAGPRFAQIAIANQILVTSPAIPATRIIAALLARAGRLTLARSCVR